MTYFSSCFDSQAQYSRMNLSRINLSDICTKEKVGSAHGGRRLQVPPSALAVVDLFSNGRVKATTRSNITNADRRKQLYILCNACLCISGQESSCCEEVRAGVDGNRIGIVLLAIEQQLNVLRLTMRRRDVLPVIAGKRRHGCDGQPFEPLITRKSFDDRRVIVFGRRGLLPLKMLLLFEFKLRESVTNIMSELRERWTLRWIGIPADRHAGLVE
jgi:hypothetical protein